MSWLPDQPAVRPGEVEWTRAPAKGLGTIERLSGLAELDGRFVLTGSNGYDNTAQDYATIWYSGDALNWRLATIEGPETGWAGSPVAFDGHFYAPVSGGVQSSDTGAVWTTLDVPIPSEWRVAQLAVFDDKILAFSTDDAGNGRLLTSSDGVEWKPVDSADAARVAAKLMPGGLVGFDGSLYAFVEGDNSTEVWRADAADEWQQAGLLPDSKDVFTLDLAANDDRLVAVSMWPDRAWYSADGLEWNRADGTPIDGFDPEFLALAATEDAFVATTGRYPRSLTGIFNEENVKGLTFASTKGNGWAPQPGHEWDGREIDLIFPHGEYLIGIGRDFAAYPEVGSVWSAPIPDLR